MGKLAAWFAGRLTCDSDKVSNSQDFEDKLHNHGHLISSTNTQSVIHSHSRTPLMSLMFMSAPFSMRSCTIPSLTCIAAQCRGVHWWGEGTKYNMVHHECPISLLYMYKVLKCGELVVHCMSTCTNWLWNVKLRGCGLYEYIKCLCLPDFQKS